MFFLLVVHFLFWGAQCIGTTNDSPGYLDTVSLFFTFGRPFYHPPGYPAFLGLVSSISEENLGLWVTLVQHGLAVAGAVWIYLLLQRMVPEGAALSGAILSGASAPTLTVSQIIMSEATTLFAMIGALYFTVCSIETGRLRFLVLAGVLSGWAVTLRVVPLIAVIPAIGIIYLLPPTKRGLKFTVVTLAVTLGFVALPISWCWYHSGNAALSNSVGLHLFNRVVTEQQQLDEEGPATKALIARLGGKDPRAGYQWWDIQELIERAKNTDWTMTRVEPPELEFLLYSPAGFAWWTIWKSIERKPAESEFLLRSVAWEGIRKDPWSFVSYTPYLAWRVLMADASTWLPYWGDTILRYPSLENAPFLTFTASSWAWRLALEEIHKVIWPVLCWLAIGGVFLGLFFPQRNLVLALAWVPIGYLLSSASVEYFNPRFNAPIIPFVTALAMIPPAFLFRIFDSNPLAVHQPMVGATEGESAVG
jgi:hypothetical protein